MDLNGESVQSRPVSERVAAGVAMVPEDRKLSGFVGTMTVEQNMTLSSLGEIAPGGYLAPARERAAAARFIDRVSDQGGESRRADGIAERRQPAEGRDCPGGR